MRSRTHHTIYTRTSIQYTFYAARAFNRTHALAAHRVCGSTESERARTMTIDTEMFVRFGRVSGIEWSVSLSALLVLRLTMCASRLCDTWPNSWARGERVCFFFIYRANFNVRFGVRFVQCRLQRELFTLYAQHGMFTVSTRIHSRVGDKCAGENTQNSSGVSHLGIFFSCYIGMCVCVRVLAHAYAHSAFSLEQVN